MRFQIQSFRDAGHKPKKAKVTCVTCKMKGCVGNCRFETVKSTRSPKVA